MRLRINSLSRRRTDGSVEFLSLGPGVNLLAGSPNSGKTTWLQMLNHLLGAETAANEIFSFDVVERYSAVSAELQVGESHWHVERRWNEQGVRSKVLVDDCSFSTTDFQKELMSALGIPILTYPKTDPASNATWPTLSFRMLLRHLYRQQRFWTDIANKQPDPETRACILLFLGLAERIFTPAYHRYFELSGVLDDELRQLDGQARALDILDQLLLLGKTSPATTPEQRVERLQTALELIDSEIKALPDWAGDPAAARALGRLEQTRAFTERYRALAVDHVGERARHAGRVSEVTPLFSEVERARDQVDVPEALEALADGMNEYLRLLNEYRPGSWRHRPCSVSMRRNAVRFNVGARRWNWVLGGTDSLYFLLAYHYALMRLSSEGSRCVPGLTIIDLPAELAGESVADQENFVVQPFVDLVDRGGADDMQVIVAGLGFVGLRGCHRITLDTAYLS